MKRYLLVFVAFISMVYASSQEFVPSQWAGKKVAYLGDSMTDPRNSSANRKYWACLKDMMGIEPYVFARSGFEWSRLLSKAEELTDSIGQDIDAIIIWCGTNDYNHSVPIGEFYTETVDTVNVNGVMSPRKHRQWIMNDSTYCGSINRVMAYLKSNYPTKQIVIMTPIHRGYANFSSKNVQPDEDYANGQGLYIEDYVDVLKRAAQLWAVPVIDLYAVSGIYPNFESNTMYISKPETDRLHPNNAGHLRIAKTMQTQLMTLPASFE